MEKTLVETFEYVLGHRHEPGNMFADIYHRLFIKLLPKEELEELLTIWLGEYERVNAYWFGEFHKSIRQCDFYGNSNGYYHEFISPDKLSSEEIIERKALNKVFGSFLTTTGKGKKDFEVAYPEISKRLVLLNKKFYKKETVSISGHLDMILYSMINSDNNFLYNVMRETFEDYLHIKNKEVKVIF